MMKKMKWLAAALVLVLCMTGLAGCSSGSSNTLTLYTWEGMFPDEVLSGFEEATGLKVNYVNFDSGETMLSKLQAAKGGDYDLAIVDDYIIETAVNEGLAQKLDTSKLSNYGNINSIYQGQFYDPSDDYTVPYGAGVMTLIYDPSAVDIDIKGYSDLWDESLRDKVGVIANPRVINGMALKVLGESYNTEDTEVIERAGGLLIDLAPNIRLIKDDNIQVDLLSGEISVGVMYTNQVALAKLENPDLEIVFPQEGIGFGIMAGFIPSNAPNADAAYQFLDYILDAEVAARCFEWLCYYCTTEAAEPYIDESVKGFVTLPEGFNVNMEMIQNVGTDIEEIHTRIWDEFRAACGQ